MKKSLHLIAVLIAIGALAFSSIETKAQLPAGSIAPNFTFTDMNSVSQDLYTYLNAGKTVYLDVSATWCAPCWSYHTSGALENLYNQYGPPGTNELMVIFVEGDNSTGNDCMNGITATCPNTQGNWVSGTPYPMCNPSPVATFNSNYAIAYFPTVYMICPNRIIKEVGQLTTAGLYAEKANCPAPASQPNDPALLSYTGTKTTCSAATISVMLQNNGTSPLTACTITAMDGATQVCQMNWTGNLATYATQNVTVGTATLTATMNLNISITSADNNAANNTIAQTVTFKSPTSLPIAEGFEASTNFPTAWDQSNANAGSVAWTVATNAGGFGSSSNSAYLEIYNSPSGNIDDLNTTLYNFQFSTTPITLTFDVAYAQYQTENDKLDVRASTNCGTTWTNKYSKSGATLATAPATTSMFVPTASQWRTETVDLSSLAGQGSVLLQFRVTSAYGNNLYVDNINLTNPNTGINEADLSSYVSVFPNPTSGTVFVSINAANLGNVNVKITDVMGKVIAESTESSVAKMKFDLSGQSNGMYFVEVSSGIGMMTQKVMLNK